MTQVLLAVDFEYDLILFELLSEIDDVTIVARPADEVELLAHCRTGGADVVIIGRYFPGLDAEAVAAITASGQRCSASGTTLTPLEQSASALSSQRTPTRRRWPRRSTTSAPPPWSRRAR